MPGIQFPSREVTPKTELSLNLPPAYLFELLLNYFETVRFGGIEFSDIKKNPPSHMEGKWFVPPLQVLSGNFKIDITENNNESKVKINIDAGNVNVLALGLLFIGLLLLLIVPLVPIWLMPFGFATAFFVAGQWRRSNILREINALFLDIPEFTETLEKGYEKATVKDEERQAWVEIAIGGFLTIAGSIGSVAFGLGLMEITGLGGMIVLLCLSIGFSAISHGFQRLRRIREGGEI